MMWASSQLERLVDWGERKLDLEPEERELLERIERLAADAREREQR